jgi:hypothetical protein
LLVAVAVLACGDPAGPAADSLPEAAYTRSAAPRPFHGSIRGDLVAVDPFAPRSSAACNANFSGDPAAPGASVSLFDSADGNFSHMGRSRLEAVSCIDPLSPFSSGTGVIQAASSDELFIAFSNVGIPRAANPAVIDVEGTQWVTGGTGRFMGATGVQTCAFTIRLTSPATGTIDGSCTGTLMYSP